MRAARKVGARVPLRVAILLDAAIRSVRDLAGAHLPVGRCLSGWCTAPGCSRHSTDSHHAVLRSHGGSDDATNRTGVCEWHHHRCLHGGHLRVRGHAPDALTWERREPQGWNAWTGRPATTR